MYGGFEANIASRITGQAALPLLQSEIIQVMGACKCGYLVGQPNSCLSDRVPEQIGTTKKLVVSCGLRAGQLYVGTSKYPLQTPKSAGRWYLPNQSLSSIMLTSRLRIAKES